MNLLLRRLPLIASLALIPVASAQTAVKPISVTAFQRDGIGETGTFEADDARSSKPGGLPVISSTEKKLSYKHYDVDLVNRAKVAGKNLRVEYVIYTVSGDGRLISNSASAKVESIEPGKRATVKTRGATLIRSKTATQTIGVGKFNQVETGTSKSRSKEKFGGIWVRVYVGEKLVGERKDLEDAIAKTNPPWKAAPKDGKPSMEKGITLPEINLKIPETPEGIPDQPKLPKKPPFGK